jgi:hypothetical protein
MTHKKIKECGVAEIFFEIGSLAQCLGINLRHRQSAAVKMPGELKEGDILFPD